LIKKKPNWLIYAQRLTTLSNRKPKFNRYKKLILVSKVFQPKEKFRHSVRDTGIQPQGCEIMPDTAPNNALPLSAQSPCLCDSAG
jgi:hypothetical protein